MDGQPKQGKRRQKMFDDPRNRKKKYKLKMKMENKYVRDLRQQNTVDDDTF